MQPLNRISKPTCALGVSLLVLFLVRAGAGLAKGSVIRHSLQATLWLPRPDIPTMQQIPQDRDESMRPHVLHSDWQLHDSWALRLRGGGSIQHEAQPTHALPLKGMQAHSHEPSRLQNEMRTNETCNLPGTAPSATLAHARASTKPVDTHNESLAVLGKSRRREYKRRSNSTRPRRALSSTTHNKTRTSRTRRRTTPSRTAIGTDRGAAKSDGGVKLAKRGPKPAADVKRCEFPEGCTAPARKILYGDPQTGARFCREHREPHHFNLPNRRQLCHYPGCFKYGLFADPALLAPPPPTPDNATRPRPPPPVRSCKLHKLPGHVDVRNPRCAAEGCTRRASYGQRGSGRGPRFCRGHSAAGDENLQARVCEAAGCGTVAYFGRAEEGRSRRCDGHREAADVDLRNRRCGGVMQGFNIQTGSAGTYACTNRASFGDPEGPALYCSLHKAKGHVNLSARQCEAPGCSTTPSCSRPNERRRRFCKKHCPEGFIDHRATPPMPHFL